MGGNSFHRIDRRLANQPVPPQCGRLMPLAVDLVEEDLDASLLSVTTGGLGKAQIDAISLPSIHGSLFFKALVWCVASAFRQSQSARRARLPLEVADRASEGM